MSTPAGTRRTWARPAWIGVIALLVVLIVAIAGFVIWALTPLGPAPRALAALESDQTVAVTQEDFGWAFAPKAGPPVSGLILYPGARVDPRSYAALARAFAERGVLTVITAMPLNLAILAPQRAADVIDAYPDVHHWAVGGHSLGGAMATRYLAENPEEAEAMLLLAAYPPQGVELNDADLVSLSTRGTLDGLVRDEDIRDTLAQLPKDVRYEQIEGGNHSGFGDYGVQPSDHPATISNAQQQAAVVDLFVPMLREASLSMGD